jgi:hypothetical protein
MVKILECNEGHGFLRWTLRTNTITCARLLAYVTGWVNQELLLQNEYLAAENLIWKARLQPGWRLSDGERATLAGIGRRLGRKGLQPVARLAKPDTILAWYRNPVAEKFQGSKPRRSLGRPRTSPEIEALVVGLAWENSGWGYDRIVRALANLGTECRPRPRATSCVGTESNQFRSAVCIEPRAFV